MAVGMGRQEVVDRDHQRELWGEGRIQDDFEFLLGAGVSFMGTAEVRRGVCCERKVRGLVQDVIIGWSPEMRSDLQTEGSPIVKRQDLAQDQLVIFFC